MRHVFTQEFWDERYRSRRQVSELGVGRALDVGSGEGADTIWLAERGWRVTIHDAVPQARKLPRPG